MCKFCRFQRLYYPESHHELPPGTGVDAKITTRKIELPSEDDYSFVMESLVATMNRYAYRATKRYFFDMASVFLEAARGCQPNNSKVHDYYALFYLQQEDLENALASIKTSLRLNNSNGEAFLIASQIYRQMQKFDMALRALEIGLVCVPDTPENADVRKSLSEEALELKQEISSISEIPDTPVKTQPETTLFLPSHFSLGIVSILFSHLDYPSAKRLELVSKEWNKVAKCTEVQQEMLITHTSSLVNLISVPKDTFTLPMFYDAFKCWARLEANERIRAKIGLLISMRSNATFNPPAKFSGPSFDAAKDLLQLLPHNFLLLYSICNGMVTNLYGAMKPETYRCMLYPLDSPKFTITKNTVWRANIPVQFRTKVSADFSLKIIEIGKIKMNAPKDPKAYSIWLDFGFHDDDKPVAKIQILLDPFPLSEGNVGQLLIIEDDELVDVLPGGITQLLEYLTVLDTCNLVAHVGMYVRDKEDDHLPESLEKSYSKLNKTSKPKKLGSLFKKLKRYKSAYKGYQCTMRK